MGRPKLPREAAQTETVSGKVLPVEKAALERVIASINQERRNAGEVSDLSITDWIRSHIRRDARDRQIEIVEPGAAPKAPRKGGGKAARKTK